MWTSKLVLFYGKCVYCRSYCIGTLKMIVGKLIHVGRCQYIHIRQKLFLTLIRKCLFLLSLPSSDPFTKISIQMIASSLLQSLISTVIENNGLVCNLRVRISWCLHGHAVHSCNPSAVFYSYSCFSHAIGVGSLYPDFSSRWRRTFLNCYECFMLFSHRFYEFRVPNSL